MSAWVHVILDLPPRAITAAEPFWAAALGWPIGGPWADHPEFASFEPPAGQAYVHRQRLDGPGDPGVHLDVEVADPAAEAARLVAAGATSVSVTDDWHALRSPGGLPFCLLRTSAHPARPPATAWPGGQRGRLVQVCIDSPARRHDAEVRFWRTALSWRWAHSDSAEFAGKLLPPAGSTVQLLLHRLGNDDQGRVTRAHLDLGSDDRWAESDRLVALGARREWTGDGWVTLRDPAGMLFCVTGNSPDAP